MNNDPTSPETTDLTQPVCAGASRDFLPVCPRCGASTSQPCGDEEARTAQKAALPPLPAQEFDDVF